MQHSDLVVISRLSSASPQNQPPLQSFLSILSIGSHSFGLEFCSPPLQVPSFTGFCSQNTGKKAIRWPIMWPSPSLLLPYLAAQLAAVSAQVLSTVTHGSSGPMPRSLSHQRRRCTGGILQLFLSVSHLDCQLLGQRQHGHHQQCSNDVHYQHIYQHHHCIHHHHCCEFFTNIGDLRRRERPVPSLPAGLH